MLPLTAVCNTASAEMPMYNTTKAQINQVFFVFYVKKHLLLENKGELYYYIRVKIPVSEAEMKYLKENKKKIIIGAAMLAVIIIIIYAIPSLRSVFYFGDRFTGKVTATVNGKDFALSDNASVIFDNEEGEKLKLNGSKFSVKGGKYGAYDFCFHIDNAALATALGDNRLQQLPGTTEVHFVYINLDKKNTADMELNVNIYSEGKVLKAKLTADYGINAKGSGTPVFSESTAEFNYIYENSDLAIDFGA